MNMKKFDEALSSLEEVTVMAKAHVQAYTRKDGAFVREHEDGRQPETPKQKTTRLRQTKRLKNDHKADGLSLKNHLGSALSAGDTESDDGEKLTYGDVQKHLDTMRSSLGAEHKQHIEHAQYALNQSFGAADKPLSDKHARIIGSALMGRAKVGEDGMVR